MFSPNPSIEKFIFNGSNPAFEKFFITLGSSKVACFKTSGDFNLPNNSSDYYTFELCNQEYIFDAKGFTNQNAIYFAEHLVLEYKNKFIMNGFKFSFLTCGITYYFSPYSSIFIGIGSMITTLLLSRSFYINNLEFRSKENIKCVIGM